MITLNGALNANSTITTKLSTSSKNMNQDFMQTFQKHMEITKDAQVKVLNNDINNNKNQQQVNEKPNFTENLQKEKSHNVKNSSQETEKKVLGDDERGLKNKDIIEETESQLEIPEKEEIDIPYEILMLLQNPNELMEVLNQLQEQGYLQEDMMEDLIMQLEGLKDFSELGEELRLVLQEIEGILKKENLDIKKIDVSEDFQRVKTTFQEVEENLAPSLDLQDPKEDKEFKEDKILKPQDKGQKIDIINTTEMKEKITLSGKTEEKVFSMEDDEETMELEGVEKPNMYEELLTADLEKNIQFRALPFSIETIDIKDINISNVLEQIIQQVDVIYKEDKNQIKLQLVPENLGKLSIDLISDNQEVKAKVYVESLMVKEVIEGNLNEFRESLREKGINISNIEVSVGQDPETHQRNRSLQHRIKNKKTLSNNNTYDNTSILDGIDTMIKTNPYIVDTKFNKLV